MRYLFQIMSIRDRIEEAAEGKPVTVVQSGKRILLDFDRTLNATQRQKALGFMTKLGLKFLVMGEDITINEEVA